MKRNRTRRQFIASTAAISTVLIANTGVRGANDKLNIGCIGAGGRCSRLMSDLFQIANTRVTAVCDVWDRNLERAKQRADKNAFGTKTYQELLERKDVDAVIVATPDHWHVPITVDACEAGKDVYVEKPLTHNLAEGQNVIDAQNRNKRIVQVGMQQRSMPHIQEACELYKKGNLGAVHKIHLTWNRNAPTTQKPSYGIDPRTVDWKSFLGSAKEQPFDEFRFRQWRWFWDFGGGILTDLMVHYLDVVHMFMELDPPQTAHTIGDHVAAKGLWETPDTIQTLLHYPQRKLQVYFEGTFINARHGAMMEFMGREATLYMDRGRYEVHPENERVKYRERILGEGKKGADFYSTPNGSLLHLQNWIDCIKTREKPNAPAEAGVLSAAGAHLGNLAYREGKVAHGENQR